MGSRESNPCRSLPIRDDLVAGLDIGGTKVDALNTITTNLRRYKTTDFEGPNELLDTYFQELGARPSHVTMAMAGPRDDETGAIKMTNSDWSSFHPQQARERYGIAFSTANDMVATTAGVLAETGIDLIDLKPGTPTVTGTKLVMAFSTGIGSAAAVWSERYQDFIIAPGEGGHIGFQPNTQDEIEYLIYLNSRYPHASAELALSGKRGIGNLTDHTFAKLPSSDLVKEVQHAKETEQPVGAVLSAFATEGNGTDKEVAQAVLRSLGAMTGSVLRDLAVTHNATGGVYLTGSVSLHLGQYFATETELNTRFVRSDPDHAELLKRTPIYLVSNPHVAVVGALALAKEKHNVA